MKSIRQMDSRDRGWFFGLFSQVLWGTSGVATKLVDAALPSSMLVSLRHGIGALILGRSIFSRKRHVLKGVPIFHLVVLGILAGLPDLLLIEGIRRGGAIIPPMLARLEIPLGVLFAHWLLKEKVGLSAYAASLLALFGVLLISIRPGQAISLQDDFFVGVVLGVMTAVLWAVTGVYGKYILNRKTDPLAVSFVRLCIGSLFGIVVTVFLVSSPLGILQNLKVTDWALILYLGVFLSGLAYLSFYKSLNILDAHVVAIMLSASMSVVLIAGLLIGERISLLQWPGLGLIVASIMLVKRKPKPVDRPLDAD